MQPIGRFAKCLTALITTVSGWAVMVVNSAPGAVTNEEWIVLITGLATSALVFLVPNSATSDP